MIKIAIIAVVVSTLGGGVYWVSHLSSSLAISESNNLKLTNSVSKQQKFIEMQELNFNTIQELNTSLSNTNVAQTKEINNLRNKFNVKANGQSRDFGAITRDRPSLINKIVNRATKKVNRCIELSTGSPILPKEKNSECKELINSLTK